jgi:hypothetical protein
MVGEEKTRRTIEEKNPLSKHFSKIYILAYNKGNTHKKIREKR